MALVKKNWEDRRTEFPARRKLTPAGEDDVYDVSREEGTVIAEGDLFSAENMNDLEARVEQAILDSPGRSVAGENVEAESGTIVTAGSGAEIFNDYAARTYDDSGTALTGNVASGANSHAEGSRTTASGARSHAEGFVTRASGGNSHAEGQLTIASHTASHAEGQSAKAFANYAHAEGQGTTASGTASHAEGSQTTASGNYSHAEGYQTTASGNYSHAGGRGTTALGDYSHAEGYDNTASGDYAHAEGRGNKALKSYSHAEGYINTASGDFSHVEGHNNTASGDDSHAEGADNTASGGSSHAEGGDTIASGASSHAEGVSTTASGRMSHAAGWVTVANDYQYVIGTYNVEKTTTGQNDDRFIIGGGTSTSAKKNAFRVHSNGNVYASNYNSSGADYAEMFEWQDQNPQQEDRAGLFVTLDGERIKLAQPGDFLLGIVSASPSVVGDVYDDQWHGMYICDVFGRLIYEEQEFPTEVTRSGTVILEARRELAPVLNPDYSTETPYTPRSERAEWAAVGLLGKLVVIDDGTCIPNNYCTVGKKSVATHSKELTRFRVMSRIDAEHIRVLVL